MRGGHQLNYSATALHPSLPNLDGTRSAILMGSATPGLWLGLTPPGGDYFHIGRAFRGGGSGSQGGPAKRGWPELGPLAGPAPGRRPGRRGSYVASRGRLTPLPAYRPDTHDFGQYRSLVFLRKQGKPKNTSAFP